MRARSRDNDFQPPVRTPPCAPLHGACCSSFRYARLQVAKAMPAAASLVRRQQVLQRRQVFGTREVRMVVLPRPYWQRYGRRRQAVEARDQAPSDCGNACECRPSTVARRVLAPPRSRDSTTNPHIFSATCLQRRVRPARQCGGAYKEL